MEAPLSTPRVPPYEDGRIAPLPNAAAMRLRRSVISSRACSHVMRSKSVVCRPFVLFGATRRIGYSTRWGEYTRSRYLATLAQRKPRVTGWAGSPWIRVARPFSTVMSTPQASGQSCGQAAWTTFFMIPAIIRSTKNKSRVLTRGFFRIAGCLLYFHHFFLFSFTQLFHFFDLIIGESLDFVQPTLFFVFGNLLVFHCLLDGVITIAANVANC